MNTSHHIRRIDRQLADMKIRRQQIFTDNQLTDTTTCTDRQDKSPTKNEKACMHGHEPRDMFSETITF